MSVRVTNEAPFANAGAGQRVAVSSTVQLFGGNSGDEDRHTPLSYSWQQIGGPSVMLSDPADVSPSFTSPGVPSVLTFTLSVTDARGLADPTPDAVVIRVLDIGISGLAVTNDGPSEMGRPTTFTVTVAEGSNVTYTWDFGDGLAVRNAPTQNDASASHIYIGSGTYTASVTASNARGSVSAQTTVIVTKKTRYLTYLPLVRN
jgi:PKD repeat protein